MKKTPLSKANLFVEKNKRKVKEKPVYHFTPPVGWLNDPNGFSYFKGEYHLFYQYYPFKTHWGSMYWGHAVTKDFINWQHLPIALAPDKPYDNYLGCFSGTAFSTEGKLTLMYTGVARGGRQQQCLAFSTNGLNFEKYEDNPVISSKDLPENVDIKNFRDPKIFTKNGLFHALVGASEINNSRKRGQVLLYSSKDMINWELKGRLFDRTVTKGVLECPDIFTVDGKDILILSPQHIENEGFNFQNSSSSIYMVGKLNLENGKFTCENMAEFDSGFDFYAPQTVTTVDGRVVMTAWLNMWGRKYLTKKEGWVGSFILPRELTLKDNFIIQNPVKEIESRRKNKVLYKNITVSESKPVNLKGIEGNIAELNLMVDMTYADSFGINAFKGGNNQLTFNYNKAKSLFTIDRSRSSITKHFKKDSVRKLEIKSEHNILNLKILLDRFSAEVFLQGGVKTMTTTICPQKDANAIEFYASGKAIIIEITKYDLA